MQNRILWLGRQEGKLGEEPWGKQDLLENGKGFPPVQSCRLLNECLQVSKGLTFNHFMGAFLRNVNNEM